MKKILCIVPHRPARSPGQRFRIEQYLPFLREKGYEIKYSYIVSEKDDKIFYSKGKYVYKLWIILKSFFKRFRDVFLAFKYDIIFIYREANFLGTTFFEKLFKLSGAKIIFDFDDAIWINDVSDGNQNLKWLKRPSKTADIIQLSDLVFAGNNYLAEYARNYNQNIKVVPTTIDTSYHNGIIKDYEKESICIGWTGSLTTIKHFETAIPFLKEIKKAFGEKVYFKIIVDIDYEVPELELKSTKWKIENEISDLAEIDIGIMPLPNDEWSKGKCGFKGLQYMSLGIPTIMSPVGVNTEIITDGKNGFLAETPDEWIEKLSQLILSSELRKELGTSGKQTIQDRYSVKSQKDIYVSYFDSLLI